jgi:hypothetical protein
MVNQELVLNYVMPFANHNTTTSCAQNYTYLKGQGLKRSESNHNFYYTSENGKCVILILYVDCLLIT